MAEKKKSNKQPTQPNTTAKPAAKKKVKKGKSGK